MPLTDVPAIESSILIDAPPARVWAVISDLRNMTKWSPQTWRTFVRGGKVEGRVGLGTSFFNINRRGPLVWPTQSKVIRFVPEREVAFRVKENWTVWSYTLEPSGSSTRLVARREAPEGISDVSVKLTKIAFGGVESFSTELQDDMRETLERIKADVEG